MTQRWTIPPILLVLGLILPPVTGAATTPDKSTESTLEPESTPVSTQATQPAAIDPNSLEAVCQFPPVEKQPLQGKQAGPEQTQLQADQADMSQNGSTRFSGSVIIQRGEQRIEADQAEYFHSTEDFDAKGNLRFFDKSLLVEGERAQMNLKDNKGGIDQARYRALNKNARGTAEKLHLQPGKLVLKNGTYTSCRPGDPDWELHASEITLNSDNRQGTASHVVIDFKGVPIFYLPYMRFPIGDQRMSGLLYPGVGTSDEHGTEISIPYYWNIAPNYDATITPHSMSKRGVMLETEFRYKREQSSGELWVDYLADDKLYDDDREQIRWEHRGRAGEGWSTRLSYKEVSDENYLVDFGGSLGNISTTHLAQTATLNYNTSHWLFKGLVQNYQTIQGSQPYRQLPQLRFNSRVPNYDNQLNYNVSGEWVRFDHEDDTRIQADRFNLQPVISMPLQSDAFFLVPKLTGYYTHYQLNENAPSTETEQTRSISVFSLDTGIYLERDTFLGETPILHTLEPRLFYVYAPYKDQSELPVFDSGQQAFSFNTIFRDNRFSSVDRVGDADQLATVITTRLQHQLTGAELFSASIGQINYFSDRRVTLPGAEADSRGHSSYVARISTYPARGWSFHSDLQWDPDIKSSEFSTNRLQYRRQDLLFNLGYRYRLHNLETWNASFVWQVSPRWRVLAGNQYDLRNERNLETVYGLDYESCCWGFRLMAREYYNTAIPDNYDQGIYLSLELKGLSSFGQSEQARTILRNAIPGYHY